MNEWISVKEKLPKDGEIVQVKIRKYFFNKKIVDAMFCAKYFVRQGKNITKQVTHWSSFPDDKNQFIQYLPGFVDREPTKFDFDSQEELLLQKEISKFEEVKNFYRFSICENYLMVEIEKGNLSFVIGYVKYPERLKLTKWKNKK